MKLATLKDGSRDGQLAVVSRDLSTAHFAAGIATTLQQVLDDWNFRSPPLQDLYATLNGGKARHAFAFDARHCMAPLPRAYQRLDGAAGRSLVEDPQPSSGAAPQAAMGEPPLTPGGSDDFMGACDPALFGRDDDDIDLQAQLAVISADVDTGTGPDAALEGVRLLLLMGDWRLRRLARVGHGGGGDLLLSRPATAFAPVAVTPDELVAAWRGGRVHGQVEYRLNGRRRGLCDTAAGMQLHFGELMAHLCQTRRLQAGAIVTGGAIHDAESAHGSCSIAQARAIELQQGGAAQTAFLRFGDRVRIEMLDASGQSVFGAIDQRVLDLHAKVHSHAHTPAQTPAQTQAPDHAPDLAPDQAVTAAEAQHPAPVTAGPSAADPA